MEAPLVDSKSPAAIGVGSIQPERDSALYQIDNCCPAEQDAFEKCVKRILSIDKSEAIMKNSTCSSARPRVLSLYLRSLAPDPPATRPSPSPAPPPPLLLSPAPSPRATRVRARVRRLKALHRELDAGVAGSAQGKDRPTAQDQARHRVRVQEPRLNARSTINTKNIQFMTCFVRVISQEEPAKQSLEALGVLLLLLLDALVVADLDQVARAVVHLCPRLDRVGRDLLSVQVLNRIATLLLTLIL